MSSQNELRRALFPDREVREDLWRLVIQRLDRALEDLPERSPSPSLDMSSIRQHLSAYDFRRPLDLESVTDEVVGLLEHGMVHTQHPRYFGLFNPSPTFPGILADAITIDAHKWLAVPMGAGMILCRNQEHLGATFGVETGYMPQGVAGLDPYTHSVQWSRRFIGLKLFLSLAVLGTEGYASMIERSVELAATLADWLEQHGWTVVNDPSLAVVCFVDQRSSSEAEDIMSRVLEGGRAWISVARFEGRPVLRACITSHWTSKSDLEDLVRALNDARQSTEPPLRA